MKHLISMRYRSSHENSRSFLLGLALVSLLFLLDGCDKIFPITPAIKTIDNIINEVDNTRQTIAGQSAAWRDALPKLVNDLNGMESNIAADAKGILADTTNQVNDLATQTINLSDAKAQALIAQGGVEFRCDAGFVKAGALAQLQYIVDDLKFWKQNKRHQDNKPNHEVCWIDPSVLSLYPSGNNWLIDPSNMPEPNIVEVFGYNFRSEALPSLQLQDASGKTLRSVNLKASYVTHYQINLDFSNEKFPDVKSGYRVVFSWPDLPELNTINLTLHSPAQLKISNPVFTPPSPTAQIDSVSLKVTITNIGGSRSDTVDVKWQPDPTDSRVLPVSQKPLEAGQPSAVNFGGYTYQRGGTIPSTVSLSNGQDTQTYPLTVAPPPPPPPQPPLTELSPVINVSQHFGFSCDMRWDQPDVTIDFPQGYTWDGDTNYINQHITATGTRASDNPGLSVIGTPTMQNQQLHLTVHIGLKSGAFPGNCGTLYFQAEARFVGQ